MDSIDGIPSAAFGRTIQRICVFCGSSHGVKADYSEAAAYLGRLLAQHQLTLVYGGGRVGLMGVLADAALKGGGKVVGVIPQALFDKEIAHTGLTELNVVSSMHERKSMMADLADAFVLLPGGYGSWDEFFEILTWAQLGIHRKPCGILNVEGYYDALLSLARHAAQEGFLREAHVAAITVDDHAERLLARLYSGAVPMEEKWVRPSQR